MFNVEFLVPVQAIVLTDVEPYLFNCAAFIFELFSGLSTWCSGIQKDFVIEGKSGKKPQILILKV